MNLMKGKFISGRRSVSWRALNPTRSRYRPAGRFEALIGKYVDKDVVFGIRAEHINNEPKADGQPYIPFE